MGVDCFFLPYICYIKLGHSSVKISGFYYAVFEAFTLYSTSSNTMFSFAVLQSSLIKFVESKPVGINKDSFSCS